MNYPDIITISVGFFPIKALFFVIVPTLVIYSTYALVAFNLPSVSSRVGY
jgi:hypothetical protein